MQSNKYLSVIAKAVVTSLTTLWWMGAGAQTAPVAPSFGNVMQPPAPISPMGSPKALSAPGASATAPASETLKTISLREFERLERKKAMSTLQNEVDNLTGASTPNASSMRLPNTVSPMQMMPSYGAMQPGMRAIPGSADISGMPMMNGVPGIQRMASISPVFTPSHKVISVISFKDSTIADVYDGSVVQTIKVGDFVDGGKVVSIDTNVGVTIEVPAPIAAPKLNKSKTNKQLAARPKIKRVHAIASTAHTLSGPAMIKVVLPKATDQPERGLSAANPMPYMNPPRLPFADASMVPLAGQVSR